MAASAAQTAGGNPRFLRGPERVAALLLAMGKPLASRILKHFDVDELKQITRSVAELGVVPAPTLELLVEDFAGQFANGVDLHGSPTEVEQMLDGVLAPEQIADVMSDVTGNSNEAMWERLSNVPESIFSAYLAKEHPQTAALIISKVTPACAAKVMGQFPRDLRNEMMRRMLTIAPVTEPAVRVPMIADGVVAGYVVAQFGYLIDPPALKQVSVPPDVFITDEAFRLLYVDKVDFKHLAKYDVPALTKELVKKVNQRLGGDIVKEVLVEQFNYVPKGEISK